MSWSAPGTVPQPAPALAYSTRPITAHNPGRLIKLPDPAPLDVTWRYDDAASISFTDGLNAQTTYFYHVQLRHLEPGTRYYYQISDGAATPSTAGTSFETAPFGRVPFRFSSFGDLATPSWDLNTSGNIWHESCNNSWYAVTAIENPGDGKGAPLFHLLNGDLCYANLDVDNAPGDLAFRQDNDALVPDFSNGIPTCRRCGWSGRSPTRRNPSVDMIVVFTHQCAMSTSVVGNGSDLVIRQAWLPLFDKYEADLVLSGHEHDYERSYPVRGYDAGELGTVVAPSPGQTAGAAVSTRRPSVVTTEPFSYRGTPAWNTAEGTVYLVLGGGGTNGPTNSYAADAADDEPKAKVITTRNAVVGSEATGFPKNGADSVEDAP